MNKVLAWLLLGGAIFAVYANALDNGFVFDDYFMVVENEAIRLPPQEWPKIFRGAGGWVGSYRPLRTLSYAVDYQIGGLHPFIYHFFNVVYHWTAAFLVFLVTLHLLTPRDDSVPPETPLPPAVGALGIALLWALHPVQTESVAYISGRRDILAGLFFFFGFYAFLRLRLAPPDQHWGTRLGWTALAFLAFMCGSLAKEAAFVLPLVFFVYDLCREYNPDNNLLRNILRVGWRHRWLYGPLLAVAMGAAWYYAPYFPVILKGPGESLLATWATVPRIWLHYLKQLLFPVTLVADYSNAFPLSSSFLEWRALAATIGVLFLVTLAFWWLTRGYRRAAFGALWFMVTLLPVSHLLPHPELVAEHYLYLPSFGFCFLVGLALVQVKAGALQTWALGEKRGTQSNERTGSAVQWRRGVSLGLFAVLITFYGVRAGVRNGDWQDEVTLWRKTVETAGTSARAHHNLGVALSVQKDFGAAEQEFQRAVAADPTYGPAYTGLAEIYLASFRFDDALTAAQKGVKFRPRRAWAHWVLGMVYFRRGEYPQALAAFQTVVEFERQFAPAHEMIVRLYRIMGEEEKAVAWQRRFPYSLTPLPSGLLPKGIEGREPLS